ncbi:hypothetical protein E2P81_ATG08007 [Venturia nashicola]|uniref:RRM domain-containing protein n=1 Tax=Venturia nashicola TaxID=86259 RepID=A0A4Z1P0B2_9PEZI|nr:hypothetical protein E6O75_ATG08181 [Venturia nashicola]TLD26195.1 hypothetical protein E2P81_ATG08007 [Venturia nashicola]
MDINLLLSPSESPATETTPPPASPSPRASPAKRPGRPSVQQRKSSGLSKVSTLSPIEQSLPSLAVHNAAIAYQNQQGVFGQSATNPPSQNAGYAATSTPPIHPAHAVEARASSSQPVMHRTDSTPQMDTLADLASMRQQQNPLPRQASSAMRDLQTPSYNFQNISRPPLSARNSNEILMADAPPKEAREFKARALSEEDTTTLGELAQRLHEDSFDFSSHAQFVTLLQNGLRNHVLSGLHPREYELLADLRKARQAMDRIFPVGEKLWADWLQDEMQLAQSIDDRVMIMEYFALAVKDEPSSATLWRMYGDFMYYLWSTAYEVDGADAAGWSAEDKQVAKEVFKWDPMIDTWKRGVINTQRRLNDSHKVWDRYMEMLMLDHQKWPSPDKVENIKTIFHERLSVCHATWEETRQMFSSFLSQFDEASWESTMEDVARRSKGVKIAYAIREPFETAIEKASRNGDDGAEWNAYNEYLAWEVEKKGVFSFSLIDGLYERATIRYPSMPTLWNDYIEFLIINAPRDFEILPVMERGTRHCPWSGDLWSHRLLTMELENSDFEAIERTKHHATSTGLLDVGGMEELMKVYIAWCGCLRRRAFAVAATEDDLDIAEVAIRSALEHVKQIGEKKYGKEFAGDPHYRLERIHIKFLTQRGDVKAARANWKSLKSVQGNGYDFWYRYYIWEMVIWAKFAMRGTSEPETQLQLPEMATDVLEQGLQQIATMDWPEQLIQMYINHCEQHESVQKLRTALIEARKHTAIVERRREKATADAAAAYQNQEQMQPLDVDAKTNGKRKRNDEVAEEESAPKKNKPVPPTETKSSLAKRDREHSIIIVENLPLDADEMKVRKFFRDCGTINSIKLVSESDSQIATIEFENKEEALFAQSKAIKPFDDREIKIKFGAGTTLWVTNYPPEADRAYIKDLFKDCGEIVDIRFPSVAANVRRCFCYVQFRSPAMAAKGTSLHGTDLGGPHKLIVKISDPEDKTARGGATEEGRECYVKNVYWHVTERDVKNLFMSYGKVESVRLPKNQAGKSKGMAFVVFSDKASAQRAISKLHKTEFRDRIIDVELSTRKSSKKMDTVHRDETMSPTPEGASPSVASTDMNSNGDNADGWNRMARTLAIMNIPDTVTAARVQKLVGQFGTLKKCTLRPDHAGAIIEYTEESSVGKAELGLADKELDGQKISLGTVPELLQQKQFVRKLKLADQLAEKKKDEKKKKSQETPDGFGGLAPRQTQGATRGGGRRGGLGAKRGLGYGAAPATAKDNGEKPTGGKGNDYFKNLMAGGKKEVEDEKMQDAMTEE